MNTGQIAGRWLVSMFVTSRLFRSTEASALPLLPHVKIYSKADSLPQIKIYSKAVVSSYQQFGFYGQRLLPVTRPF